MLLTKEVEIIPSKRTIKYYRNLGYNAEYNQPLIVKINDLQNGSAIKVDVLCDICLKNIMNMRYSEYNKRMNNSGSCVCKACSYEKQKLTNLKRYGVDNYAKTKECQDKITKTILSRYGVKRYSQTQEYKEKFHNTCTERYGEDYYSYFTEKAFNTFYKKTGYENPSKAPYVKDKRTKTFIEHYGYENPNQTLEVRRKIAKTLYENSSQKSSTQQRYLCGLYNGVLNYPISYYNADIYLSNDNFVIEYDGGGHKLNVVTGRETEEEYLQKEIIRNNIIKREGYKQMKIISFTDNLPSDDILLKMLSDARQYFVDYPNHSWIEFDIDNSIVRNAENKNGILYDFGDLRKITQDAA